MGKAARIIKLEAASWRSWRAFIRKPIEQWTDKALLGFLGEDQGWPLHHDPTDAELEAIAAGWGERAMLDAERDAEGEGEPRR